MGFSSLSGRARTNPSAPQAHALCDKCGFRYNRVDLRWQMDWRGKTIQNLNILVCANCEDSPQEQLRAFAVPADPLPISNPRIQDFDSASNDSRTISGQDTVDFWTGIKIPGTTQRVTQTNDIRETQQIGKTGSLEHPPGLDPNASMPLFGTTAYNVKLPVTAITANGSAIITVTCSSPHNLITNNQVSIEGSALSTTDGFYSVTVVDALNFTYYVATAILGATALLLSSTIVKTVLVGVPRGQSIIPHTGG